MTRIPAAARAAHAAIEYLSADLLGGPRVVKQAWAIDLHKGATGLVVLVLMWAYDAWTVPAWVYLALHGSYGVAWVLKDAAFPDRSWQRRVTWGGALFTFVALGIYWLFPWFLVSGVLGQAPPGPPLLALAIALHTIGLGLMLAADAQKHFTLREGPHLIQDGLFRRVRHPNYLGEMMLYGAYAVLVNHWLAWVILGATWLVVFLPNMLVMEASLARYPEWEGYRAKTGMVVPRVVGLRGSADP